jgi:hypothetical protein
MPMSHDTAVAFAQGEPHRMKFPFPLSRDGENRLWPQIIPRQAGPSDLQRNTLAARHMNCFFCIFWDGTSPRSGRHHGECKRRAPVLLDVISPANPKFTGDPDFRAIFPMTAGSDWCGDFAAAPIDETQFPSVQGDESSGESRSGPGHEGAPHAHP